MTFLPKLMGLANELLAFPVGRPDRSEVTACVPQLLVAVEIPNASSVILQRFIGETIRMTRRCFVISPIAAHNSEIREHADDVFDFIIKPAMDELGIEAYRSDHSQEIGRITEQMFNSILNDDLCIAVLTYFNPNVFYELAIAQSAARPVIILIEKGQTIPFDVRDLRAVEYDLRPRPLRDKVYVQQIINLAKGLEKSDWIVPVPFGNNLTPLGFKGSELKLHDKLENFGPSDRWMQLLREATSQIDLTGLSLRWWRKLLGFGPLLREKAKLGCKIRAMLVASFADQFHDERLKSRDELLQQTQESRKWFTELGAESNLECRLSNNGCLNHQLVRVDSTMLISIPLKTRGPTSQFPLLECSASSPLYGAFAEEFESLWRSANPESPVAGDVQMESG